MAHKSQKRASHVQGGRVDRVVKSKRSAYNLKMKQDVFMAASVGNTQWLQQSLFLSGCNLNEVNEEGLNPLHIAAIECQLGILKLLVSENKCQVNQASSNGWTALHLAINNTMVKKSVACVKFLLSAGADASFTTSSGVTPMHQAAAAGNIECIQMLLNANGKLNAVDSRGHTPLSLAILWGHGKCCRLLKHHQWIFEKDIEAKTLKLREVEMKERQRLLEERKKIDYEERSLRAQAAYRAWLSKNNFAFLPHLFGPVSKEERKSREEVMRPHSELSAHTQALGSRQIGAVSSDLVRSSMAFRSGAISRATGKGIEDSDDKVHLIPLSSLGIAASKRPATTGIQFETARRQLQQGRPKIIQKRGVLQFPVI